MREYTQAQNLAITQRDKTLLISAAAGSGKTATLIERIIRKITDKQNPSDISRMLIVTFTKAAAGELRGRVYTALTEALAADPANKHIARQILLLENAKICTIDSFCLDVVRANFQRLGLSPTFRVADTNELALLYRSVINDLIDENFEAENDKYQIAGSALDFAKFVDNFAGARDDKNISEIFISLYEKISSYPEGAELINASAQKLYANAESDFFDTPYGKIISEYIKEEFTYYKNLLKEATKQFALNEKTSVSYLPAFEADLYFANDVLKALDSGKYEDVKNVLESYSPAKLGSVSKDLLTEKDEFYKSIRNEFKDSVKALKAKYFCTDGQAISLDMKQTADMCMYIYKFMSDFSARLEEEKKRRGILGFNDIERYSLRVLYDGGERSDIAKSMSELYEEIYIDEYQDVNAVQDKIFCAISKENNKFIVGDIKQSIYSFRGAEPSIFSNYRKTYPKLDAADGNQTEASIFMSDNFRCDEKIVKFANKVSAFSMCHSSIGYLDEDNLVFSKKENFGNNDVNLWVFQPEDTPDEEDDEDDTRITPEARAVAKEIKRLINGEKKNNGAPVLPGDIAIIVRSMKSSAPAFIKALENEGIASTGVTNDNFFEREEILLLLCLLNSIDNPRRDIYFAGLMRSPIFNFTMSDIVALRDYNTEGKLSLYDMLVAYCKENDFPKGKYLLEKLETYREMSEGMAVDKLIWLIYRDTGIFSLLCRDDTGDKISEVKRDNIMYFYEYARNFEASSFKGLYNFIKYINSIIEETNGNENAQTPDESEKAVKIMTVHQSKGLEMPICFVSSCAKQFNEQDFKESIQFDYDTGVTMRLRDSTGFAKCSTPVREAIILKKKSELKEEEMRVLYVALTRARERLYVTAQLNKINKNLVSNVQAVKDYTGKYTVMRAKSFAEWILSAIDENADSDFCKVKYFDSYTASAAEEENQILPEAEEVYDEGEIAKAKEEIAKTLDFVYPYASVSNIPAKLSVSRLYPEILNSDTADGEPHDFPTIKSAPNFIGGNFSSKAAERGTATHIFMQFCDFERLVANGAENEIAYLLEKGFISRTISELIDLKQIEKFVCSPFLQRMRKAKKMWREFRFNINLPACMFTTEEARAEELKGETVLVQGVIDSFFEEENGDIILCDYKTDRLTGEELADRTLAQKKLAERHGKQLLYYKKAIFEICGKEPKHIYIYSLPLGDTVEINV